MAKKKRKTRGRRTTARSGGGAKKKFTRRGRPSTLHAVSYDELQRELERRHSRISDLEARRDELLRELQEVEGELTDAGAAELATMPPRRKKTAKKARGRRAATAAPRARRVTRKKTVRRGGRRPRNEMNLVEALRQLLSGQTMSVTEAADAVQKAGYKTSSANFRTIVNQALLSNPNAFKKVSRGKYTAK